jgi:glycosyltransferase involved in cell wall biosynthesis
LKILKEEMKSEIPIVFVGADFGNRKYIEDKAQELGLGDQIHVLGFVDQEDLIGLYLEAFALSYLSYFGPENLPPLEAMALGCPVIAANVAGAEDQFGNAALLVNPSQPKEIAATINKLDKNSKLRERLISLGKKRAAKWTSDDFVKGAFIALDEFESIRSAWLD